MSRSLRIACGIVTIALVLSGCRYASTYTINNNGTVSGRVYVALYQDPAEASVQDMVDSQAQTIADSFTTSVKTPHNEGDWIGYYINISNEPLSSFADPPEQTWDVKITKSGNEYRVFGYTATAGDQARASATDDSGYLELDVHFPGNLIEATGATDTTVSPGWAHFNLLTIPLDQTPYARGSGPPPPPDPDPVVTIVIPPSPVVTPEVTPSVTPSEIPSPSPSAVSDEGEDTSIPVWVWAVGGGLLVALAGMIGFALANRKPAAPTEPAGKSKAKPKAEEPVEDETEDDELGDEPEDIEPEEKPKKKPPSKKPPSKK